ncbi:MAG: D-glycero-beta-D-manno-heptose 1-phosphate adenylyltransferase [Cytophagaceae bacterium]|nr:D-glycero-beta-D-manno-heptose 1-phosphate adenylyltransferase [Cytophagaceae bacterium]
MTSTKILSLDDAQKQVAEWKNQGNEVVFTNGCFDILHLGHVDYLEKASKLGQKMVVALNTDKSVSQLKGPERPINNEYARARIIASLGFVDAVILFGEETPLSAIETLIPDILVKGNDYTIDKIVGADFVLEHGGKVETIPLVEGYSTTNIVSKLKK